MLGKRVLDFLLVQELSGELESQWQLLLEHVAIGLDLQSMSVLKLSEGLTVLLLGLQKIFVPLLVELLILLNVSLLALLALLGLVEDELLEATVVVLLLKLRNTVLGHLGLDVLALLLASDAVVLQHLTIKLVSNHMLIEAIAHESVREAVYLHEILDVVGIGLLVKSLLSLSVLLSGLHVFSNGFCLRVVLERKWMFLLFQN